MTEKIIIFDFDGTLADTLDAVVRITNRLAGEFGYKKASQDDIEYLRNLNSMQIIKTAGIPLVKVPFLLQRVKMELTYEIKNLVPIPQIETVLEKLKFQGNKLGIITSNSTENVMTFLKNNEWQYLFDFIYSGTTLFGKNKVINKFLRQENINPDKVIYVGDETRDIEAAKKTQIKVIAVSWGFNSKEVLAAHKPDFLIDHPKELIDAIASWQELTL